MNLKNVKHINKFRRLPYPKNKMLIVSSGTLALLGLRKNKDLDIWVTKDLINKISKNSSYRKEIREGQTYYITKDGNIELSDKLYNIKDKVEEQIKRSITIYGIHFQSPEDIIDFKKGIGREKDLRDVKLLEDYLKKKVVENYLSVIQKLK
ncbi:MAG: hypothetical protein ACFFG0_01100 [Candidatus Thorarchaeota archaeon]